MHWRRTYEGRIHTTATTPIANNTPSAMAARASHRNGDVAARVRRRFWVSAVA
jgi:hypothetical protein